MITRPDNDWRRFVVQCGIDHRRSDAPVAIYFNLHPDHFFSYEHGHPLQKVFSYDAPTASELHELAEEAFGAFNAPLELLSEAYRAIAEQYRAAGNRSLSVGDVIRIGDTWLACASAGWVQLESAPIEVSEP